MKWAVQMGGRSVPGWRLAARVLLVEHGGGCRACAELVEQVRTRAERWERWGVRLLVVGDGEERACSNLPGAGPCTADARETGGGAVLLVVDRRGQVAGRWDVIHPETPDWREVDETVRWVGVQEPECGTCSVEPAWEEAAEEAVWKST